jgi:hypothetical protein
MRTDADDPARVRDPAIELLLNHDEQSRLWHRLRRGLNQVGNLVGVRNHPYMT